MEAGEANVGKMEKQLKIWGAEIDGLAVKADEAGTEVGTTHRRRVDNLKAKYRVAQSKLAELKAAGDGKWDTLETGIESAWNDLRVAFRDLRM